MLMEKQFPMNRKRPIQEERDLDDAFRSSHAIIQKRSTSVQCWCSEEHQGCKSDMAFNMPRLHGPQNPSKDEICFGACSHYSRKETHMPISLNVAEESCWMLSYFPISSIARRFFISLRMMHLCRHYLDIHKDWGWWWILNGEWTFQTRVNEIHAPYCKISLWRQVVPYVRMHDSFLLFLHGSEVRRKNLNAHDVHDWTHQF